MRFPTQFRAWSSQLERFGYAGTTPVSGTTLVVALYGEELSACTEIPDKNGRLIWTGDILRNSGYMDMEGYDVTVSDDIGKWASLESHVKAANYVVIGNRWEGKHE